MFKMIVSEYFGEWKISRIKNSVKDNQSIIPLLTFTLQSIVSIIFNESRQSMIISMSLLIPAFYVYFSIVLHSAKRGKMFYLCPLDREARLKNIQYSYFYRLIFYMFIFSIGLLIIGITSGINFLSFLIIFILDIIFSSLVIRKELVEYMFGFNIFFVIYYYFNLIVQMVVIRIGSKANWGNYISLVFLVLLVLPLYVKYYENIRVTLNEAADY